MNLIGYLSSDESDVTRNANLTQTGDEQIQKYKTFVNTPYGHHYCCSIRCFFCFFLGGGGGEGGGGGNLSNAITGYRGVSFHLTLFYICLGVVFSVLLYYEKQNQLS